MNLIQKLWNDESGVIMSAEAVTIGTVGVLGSIVGLTAAGNAINGELKEMASAIRSLDQSYGYRGHRSCNAWTAGSCYVQPDVDKSIADLSADGSAPDIKTIQQQIDAERKARREPPSQAPTVVDPAAAPQPNQIPVSAKKAEEPQPKSE